jgi:formate transporter
MDHDKAGGVDPMLPPEMARRCEEAGFAKAGRDAPTLLALGALAGAFIAFGAVFMLVVATGSEALPYGVGRLLAGLAFSLGLILVIVGGAELFTGDALMVMAWAGGRIRARALARAWALVYLGNIAGALATAALVFAAGLHEAAGGAVGRTALAVADAKAALPWPRAFALAVLCNVLVCLAVWMSFGARDVVGKVAVIVPPIAAFVAAGFEHSIANLYFLPYALALQADGFGAAPALTPLSALANVAVTTAGNLLGGSVLVGAVYWFIYRRGTGRAS